MFGNVVKGLCDELVGLYVGCSQCVDDVWVGFFQCLYDSGYVVGFGFGQCVVVFGLVGYEGFVLVFEFYIGGYLFVVQGVFFVYQCGFGFYLCFVDLVFFLFNCNVGVQFVLMDGVFVFYG